MFNLLSRIFKQRPPELKSTLTAQQACAIAEKAIVGTEWVGLMTLSRLINQNGKLVWAIGSATRGCGMSVMIDDATGVVISCEQLHGR